MATYRKRGGCRPVQVRKLGHRPVSRTFKTRADAEVWARATEAQMDSGTLPQSPHRLREMRLSDLIERYRDCITPRKKSRSKEHCRLNRILKAPMARLTLDRVGPRSVCALPR